MLTTCPYFDNRKFDIFDAGGAQRRFSTSLTITVRIRTLSVHWLKLNLVTKIKANHSMCGHHFNIIQCATLVKILT